MQQWWENLAAREKKIVLIGGIFLGIFIFYQFIISPIHHGLQNTRITVQQDQELLQWMQATAQQITSLKGGSVSGQLVGTEALLTTTDQSVRNSPITNNLSSIQQNSNNTIDVKFSSVSFDALAQWMITLRQQYGIQAKQVLITRINNQGIVQASITLEAAS
ncbi:MAG: type II secretion system protein GspM [Gammaproteobacteria bacterium]